MLTGRDKRVKRKSTKSLPASAKRTFLCFLSMRSFKLTGEAETDLVLGLDLEGAIEEE